MKRMIVPGLLILCIATSQGCIFSSDSDDDENNRGTVQGTVSAIFTNGPVPGVKVWLVDTSVEADTVNYENNRRAFVDSTVTDASGKYAFTSVTPGEYGVVPVFEDTSAVYVFTVRQDGDPNEFSLDGGTRTVNFTAERKGVPGIQWDTYSIIIRLMNYTGGDEWVSVSRKVWFIFIPCWDAPRAVHIDYLTEAPMIQLKEPAGFSAVFYTMDNVFQISGPVSFEVGFPLFDTNPDKHFQFNCSTGKLE